MNSERLEMIKSLHENDEEIHQFDIDWLIEQASLFHALLEENQLLYGKLNRISDILEEGRQDKNC